MKNTDQVLEVELKQFRELYRQSWSSLRFDALQSSPFKKRFFNRPIRFPGSNFDSGEINGNVIVSARSKDLNA